jgi:SAM-dependent methyltransferase
MTEIIAKTPAEIVKEVHSGYYSAGSFADDRYEWTIQLFLPQCQNKRILEVGCGSGGLLDLLKATNQVVGVDAARDGIAACVARGIEAYCIDPSSEPLPFPTGSFDFVICLETMEHMMNPYYALMEMRRVLKGGGRLICSVPNPIWGHVMLYPGLFDYGNFRSFLEQCDFEIVRVDHWQWAPRETILPAFLRRFALLRSRYVAGVLRKFLELAWKAAGRFPYFCYWLWTFDAVKVEQGNVPPLERQSAQTAPKG